ncbi:hypothetical protein VIGAN_10083900 [Vigna angularis var. angularis]|uniref:Uncharacterized protein n=1 Tax=Vigna angularis var. angularis TaxID=157739 RepID=A0A0S3T2X3_PHAAN|nr:hypothetical protein VIGAN_10083900 [Vigna angularis var. angularis]
MKLLDWETGRGGWSLKLAGLHPSAAASASCHDRGCFWMWLREVCCISCGSTSLLASYFFTVQLSLFAVTGCAPFQLQNNSCGVLFFFQQIDSASTFFFFW